MQMKGTVTEIKTVYVDILPSDVIRELKARWKRNTEAPGEYINQNNKWESWEDTHGSGITCVYRQATDEEIEVWNAFKIIEKLDFKSHK